MMASGNVNKRLDFEQVGEDDQAAERQKIVEELGDQIRVLTERLAKLQGDKGEDTVPFGYTNVPTPLKAALRNDHVDLHRLSSSVVKVKPSDKDDVPDPKYLKSLKVKIFDGSEEYLELGPNFADW
jgi:hypothetical protein